MPLCSEDPCLEKPDYRVLIGKRDERLLCRYHLTYLFIIRDNADPPLMIESLTPEEREG